MAVLIHQPERINKRIHVALPIRVTRWDKENRPVLEMACTYDISPQGARVTGLRDVREIGEIVAIERGRNGKAFCRVVWVGEPNSELKGQVGIECVETERTMWGTELRDMDEAFDAMHLDKNIVPGERINGGQKGRRRQPRFDVKGFAEFLKTNSPLPQGNGGVKNLSEMGCLMATNDALLPGDNLKLVLQLANYDLTVRGQVRHVAPELGVGVEFSEIRKGDRQVLQFLLRKLAEQQFEEAFELEP
jgi:hypothetical protein